MVVGCGLGVGSCCVVVGCGRGVWVWCAVVGCGRGVWSCCVVVGCGRGVWVLVPDKIWSESQKKRLKKRLEHM